MTYEKAVDILENNQAFLVFLARIHEIREQEIKSLRGAGKDDVMRVAGRVDAYDEILDQGRFMGVMARFEAINR